MPIFILLFIIIQSVATADIINTSYNYGTIMGSDVNLRESPTTNSSVLSVLELRRSYQILTVTTNEYKIGTDSYPWYYIKLENNQVGWVYGKYMNTNGIPMHVEKVRLIIPIFITKGSIIQVLNKSTENGKTYNHVNYSCDLISNYDEGQYLDLDPGQEGSFFMFTEYVNYIRIIDTNSMIYDEYKIMFSNISSPKILFVNCESKIHTFWNPIRLSKPFEIYWIEGEAENDGFDYSKNLIEITGLPKSFIQPLPIIHGEWHVKVKGLFTTDDSIDYYSFTAYYYDNNGRLFERGSSGGLYEKQLKENNYLYKIHSYHGD